MSQPQFAILRFAKYKGPEISNIEAHNERTKEEYASNPDIDKRRSYLNFHLLNRNANIALGQKGRSRTPLAAPVQTVCGWWRFS